MHGSPVVTDDRQPGEVRRFPDAGDDGLAREIRGGGHLAHRRRLAEPGPSPQQDGHARTHGDRQRRTYRRRHSRISGTGSAPGRRTTTSCTSPPTCSRTWVATPVKWGHVTSSVPPASRVKIASSGVRSPSAPSNDTPVTVMLVVPPWK